MADTPNNIVNLLTALVTPCTAIEAAFQQLFTERFVDTAIGAQLDIVGKIVGQDRNGMSDDDYRRYCRARIATNRSRGTVEDLLKIAGLVIGDPAATLVEDTQGVAAYVLRWGATVPPANVADILIDFLTAADAAGVRGILESLSDTEPNTLVTATAAFLSGAHSIGATSLHVNDTSDFPATGTVDIDFGLSSQETVTYTSKDATHLLGVSALTQNHVDQACVQMNDTNGQGLSYAAILALGVPSGSTGLTVDSTSGFPSSGSLDISDDDGATVAETVTYTSTDATHFLGVSALTLAHSAGAYLLAHGTPNGGSLANARDKRLDS